MTYLWQEERGKKYYRLQTNDNVVYQKIKRRKGFKIVTSSLNEKPLWIYSCQFSRPDIAKKTICSVTGQKNAIIDSEGLLYFKPMIDTE